MKKITICLLFCMGLFASSALHAQSKYSTPKEVKERLSKIVSKYPEMAKIESLTKTPSSNDVWAVTLGKGDVANHPAVAVVAGVDARHFVGIETSIRLIESFLTREGAEAFLSKNTVYVFPCVNPDATETFFGKLVYENSRTKSLYDNDRDGLMSEDGFDDLDNNGLITAMIVETEGGEYIKHPADARVIVKADPAKGQTGIYKLFTEGIDNDKDGLINEDGVDGVDLNRNFTYKYQNWGTESGNYAISEVENRALLDFMYDAFNIHTVITLGTNENMCTPVKYVHKTRKAVDTPKHEIINQEHYDNDNLLANQVSKLYKSIDTTANDIMAEPAIDGNFLEWAYYHYGRNSFGTTVWSVDNCSCSKESKGSCSAKKEIAFLKWADKNGVSDCTVDWTTVEHPDFKGQNVEVGSLKPYAMFTPPLELIEPQIEATIKTVAEIAAMKPELTLSVDSESLGKGVYRINAKVVNAGKMATATAIGLESYFTKYVRVELKLKNQNLLQGNRLLTVPSLQAGEAAEFSWLVEGTGKFEMEVGCPQSGYVSEIITL
ncbi:MAG: M14 family zinc carboxypeptidase [Rikenellaceae bacterium]